VIQHPDSRTRSKCSWAGHLSPAQADHPAHDTDVFFRDRVERRRSLDRLQPEGGDDVDDLSSRVVTTDRALDDCTADHSEAVPDGRTSLNGDGLLGVGCAGRQQDCPVTQQLQREALRRADVFGVGTRVCPAVVLRHDRLDRSLPRHLELDAGF